LDGCATIAGRDAQTGFAPIKRNLDTGKTCTFEHRPGDIRRPVHGIIEGNASFTTPSWELYVIDLDNKKLSKIESVWNYEGGKILNKPNRIRVVNLGKIDIQTVVGLANSIWESPTATLSHSMPDRAWNIDLVDGQEKKCQSGLGEALGDGGLLIKAIYTIWESRQPPQQ
jgi:hypothetical protein